LPSLIKILTFLLSKTPFERKGRNLLDASITSLSKSTKKTSFAPIFKSSLAAPPSPPPITNAFSISGINFKTDFTSPWW
jgi:hypothetical protein